VIWTRAFEKLCCIQRRLRQCRGEVKLRECTPLLPASRRKNLGTAKKEIKEHHAAVRDNLSLALLEVDLLFPDVADILFASNRPEVIEPCAGFRFRNFALAPARAAGACERRGATRGSVEDHTVTHSCADPSVKDPAVGEGFLNPALLQAGAPLCGERPFSEELSPANCSGRPAAMATGTVSPARAHKSRGGRTRRAAKAKKVAEDIAAKKAVEDAA